MCKIGIVVLESHVLYLYGEELAPLLAVAEDVSGGLGVYVNFYDSALAEEYHGISGSGYVILYLLGVEGCQVYLAALQAEEELCAVAECEFRVLVEQGEIHRLRLCGGSGGYTVGNAQKRVLKAVEDVQ